MNDRTCVIDGCDRQWVAKQLCSKHYARWKKHGDPLYTPPPRPTECIVDECGGKVTGHGYCVKHYTRWLKHGDPTITLYGNPVRSCKVGDCGSPGNGGHGWCAKHYRRWYRHGDPEATSRIVGDDEKRFWSYTDKEGPTPEHRPDLGPCWLWTGAVTDDGYGVFAVTWMPTDSAHRWSYIHHRGAIPDGLEIDHLCHVRNCVNPDHMEPVTHAENIARSTSFAAVNAAKTHCPAGHPYDEENTRIQARGGRLCKTCQRDHQRRRSQAS